MRKLIAKASQLSCLLDASVFQWGTCIPEPHRMQPDLCVCIPYSEYQQYISLLNTDTQVMLFSGTHSTMSAMSGDMTNVFSCFIKDVSFSLVKEIWFSERWGSDCTLYIPTSANSQALDLESFIKYGVVSPGVQQSFIRELQSFGYTLNIKRSANKDLLKFAVLLYNLSMKDLPENALNFEM